MEKNILNSKRKRIFKERMFVLALLFYPLANFLVFYIIVNANSIFLAFKNIGINGEYLGLTSKNFVLAIDKITLSGGDYLQGLKNSLIWYLISTVCSMVFTLLFSFYVYKKEFFSKVFRIILMLPQIISPVVVGLMFQKFIYALPVFFDALGVKFPNLLKDVEYAFGTNLFYSLWGSFGSVVIIYSNTMTSVDPEVVESAHIDGVTDLQELIYITFPLIWSVQATYIVTGIVGILGNSGPLYLFYTYDAPFETTLVGYLLFKETMRLGSENYPVLSAIGLFMTIITFPVVMLVKKGLDKIDPTN